MQDVDMTRSAFDEVAAVVDISRPASEWLVWAYPAVGLTAAVILAFGPPITTGIWSYLVTVAAPSLAVGLVAFALSQPVVGRRRRRIDPWVAGPFFALVIIDVAYRLAARPQHIDPVVVVLALLPLAPCLWAAFEMHKE